MSEIIEETAAPKKRGLVKILAFTGGALVLVAGGVGGGLYATGYFPRGAAHGVAEAPGPKLVPKAEQKRFTAGGEGAHDAGAAPPAGEGGDRYASNYYALDKEFTSNLQDSVHFIQIGLAVSTPYDDTVIDNIKTNEIAVRSSILMALGDTTEEQVFSTAGKKLLQARLAKAINATLKEKEGFGGVGNVYFTNFVVQ
ncbi:flagellar basal body-associated FliL family protein [Sphingomonas endolithica]|uniref:flagellar basal body-associated FliL family protein n=1 Tax=Sphingomonas endolithica TaxID=2972485 RepID=UPI0021AE877C|nr:flagellar basal body-associated FliL family protein [Sphingomonas sp. ZFBP2030]